MKQISKPSAAAEIVFAATVMLAISCGAISVARGQLPATRLDAIFPCGTKPGGTVEVSIVGADLDDVVELTFSHAGITAARKMVDPTPFDSGPQPVENRFVVSVRADVPPGHYAVRCVGKYGTSNRRTFVVDALEPIVETEPNNNLKEATEVQVPCAIDGQFGNAGDQDYFRLSGVAGQRLTVTGVARRIDSRAELQMTLFSADGRAIGESAASRQIDAVLDATLPVAGEYHLRVRDVLHGGGAEYPYRLLLSSSPQIAFVFPPAGLPGSNDEYEVYGFQLPSGRPAPFSLNGRPLEVVNSRIAIPADAAGKLQYSERLDAHQFALDGVEFRVSSPQGSSNAALITVAASPLVREQNNNNTATTAQKLIPPCEVAGQFFPQRDQDWFSWDAKAGEVYWIEVWSHRLGVPTDPSLIIQQVIPPTGDQKVEKSTVIANIDDVDQRYGSREFDQRSFDPAYRFVAPADGTYRLLIREGYSQLHDAPNLIYRLVIRKPQPDFRLVAVPIDTSGSILLRKGGREAIRVIAARRDGFDGEITINAAGLPAGVTSSEVVLGPANYYTTLIVSADPSAAVVHGSLQITGKAKIDGQEVVRAARFGTSIDPLQFNQPNGELPSTRARLIDALSLSVADEASRIVVSLGDGKILETARGGVLKIPYSLTRQDGAGGTLTGFPIGLPANIGLPQVAIGANTAGDFELRLQSNTPPGTYSFYLAASAQGMNYTRNPEAAAKAKERQEFITKAATEAQQKLTQSQQAAQQAATIATTATNEQNAAKQAMQASKDFVAMAVEELKVASDKLTIAKQKLAEKPEDASFKEQVVNRQTDVDNATKKRTAAEDMLKVAETKLTETTALQKTALENKQKADESLQAAQKMMQIAQQEKQKADEKSQRLQQSSATRGYNLNFCSQPLTIKIAEYPIRLSGPPDQIVVKQNAMLELPLKVERLYGFSADVTTQLVLPAGVAGLQGSVTIPGAQADGKLILSAQANATPGNHSITLRTTMNFNGQPLTLDRVLTVNIEKVEPPK